MGDYDTYAPLSLSRCYAGRGTKGRKCSLTPLQRSRSGHTSTEIKQPNTTHTEVKIVILLPISLIGKGSQKNFKWLSCKMAKMHLRPFVSRGPSCLITHCIFISLVIMIGS